MLNITVNAKTLSGTKVNREQKINNSWLAVTNMVTQSEANLTLKLMIGVGAYKAFNCD